MTRAAKLLVVPVFVLLLLLFIFISQRRFVDGDEGFYLLASRLVLMHKKPYLDFFYTQAPLLPYIYALWMKCIGMSWTSARVFTALLTSLLGALLFEHVCHTTRTWLAGLSAVVAFAASTLVFGWFPVVKTHSLAELFLFSSYVVLSGLSPASPAWLLGASGLLFGLSVDTRAYLLLIAPVFLWWIFHNTETRARSSSILWFLGGLTAGVVPALYLFVSAPNIFLFNNLGYHAIRSEAGLIGMWREKLAVVLLSFLGGPDGNGIQSAILLLISMGFVFSIDKPKYAPRLAFQIAIALGIISLLPTPVHPEYFCLCIPFLIVSAVCVVADLFPSAGSKRDKLLAAAICVLLFGIYLAPAASDFRKYLVTGDGITAIRLSQDREDWRLQRIVEVSQAIDQLASPGENVASLWPGYVFQTEADPFPGLENDFGLPCSEKLTPKQRTKYHIISRAEFEANLTAHTPRIVVLGNLNRLLAEAIGDTAESSLRAQGYTLARSIGRTSIYVCCAGPSHLARPDKRQATPQLLPINQANPGHE